MQPEMQPILDYIHKQYSAGYNREQIVKALQEAGYAETMIQDGMSQLRHLETVPYEEPKPPEPKKHSRKKVVMAIGMAGLCLIAMLASLYIIVIKKSATKITPFDTITQQAYFFKKPQNWSEVSQSDKETHVYAAKAPASLNETVVAGYEALGEDFAKLPKDQQSILLQKLRNSATPEGVFKSSVDKDCRNIVLSPFKDVEYAGTLLAMQSTGTCQLNGVNKNLTILTVVLKNGLVAIMTVSVDAKTYKTNQTEIDHLIHSIAAR